MRIGIDGNEANIKRRVGVNVYAFELLRSIYQLQTEKSVKEEFTIFLKSVPLPDLPPESDFWHYQILPDRPLWVVTSLLSHLFFNYFSNKRLDLFFTPSHYAPPLTLIPKICTIMDLGYLEFSDQFTKYDYWQLRLWSAWSILTSKRILAISKASKRDILRHYPSSQGKVTVTYPAFDKNIFNQGTKVEKKILKKYRIQGKYILFLSTLKPSKNILGLLTAWKYIESQFPDTKLVIAGKKGWLYGDIFIRTKELGLTKRVIFPDFVSEDDKPSIIAGAKVFVLPSFWEGFGLDILSALSCGVPVTCSSRGSLPEVVGDAGLMFNPEDPSEISEKISYILRMSKKDYNKLARSGAKQADKFSWGATASETLKIFELL